MDKRFNRIIKKTLHFEMGNTNGYSDVVGDTGGVTFMGVTMKSHPELSIWKSLHYLTERERKAYRPNQKELTEIYQCYYDRYYLSNRINELTDDNLALNVFDMCVNAGKWGVKLLQRVVGEKEDGILGDRTLKAANSRDVLSDYRKARRQYYVSVSKKGNNSKFLRGWLRRVDECIL